MATISSYRDLRVFVAAFEAAMRISRISKHWPADERYELTSQIRRSSRSVCACIAEAWRKRRYPAAFVSKLNDAEAEAESRLEGGRGPNPQSPSRQGETEVEAGGESSATRPDPQSRRSAPRRQP